MSSTKVIGYFSQRSSTDLYCDGEALVVAGSHATMKRMLSIAGVAERNVYSIKKARFCDVAAGLERGGAYAFDEEAYGRFAPLAKAQGTACADYDFSPSTPDEIKLVTISLR